MTPPESTPEASHTDWTVRQVQLLDSMDVPENRASRMMLFEAWKRTGLSPFARQIYVALRNGRWKVETSIHGMRSVASQEESYDGQVGPHWCGEDGEWKDVWPSKEAPVAARVGIRVKGRQEPTWGVCHFDEFVVRHPEGGDDPFWVKMPRNQIAKCAEAQALRKEFSHLLGGIYTADEMGSEDPGSVIEAQEDLWSKQEKDTFRRSAALIEEAALEKDVPEFQREVLEAVARMHSIVAEPDAHKRYTDLRTMWMKTRKEIREAKTPEGPPFKELLTGHLEQAKNEVDGRKPEPEGSEGTETSKTTEATEATEDGNKAGGNSAPESEAAGEEQAALAPEHGEDCAECAGGERTPHLYVAPAPQEPERETTEPAPARRRRAASRRRAAPAEPVAAEKPVEAVVSGSGNDGERLKLKCGCDREWVLVQGEHQKGCTKGRK